jgi:hypothetical protein
MGRPLFAWLAQARRRAGINNFRKTLPQVRTLSQRSFRGRLLKWRQGCKASVS